MSIGQFTVPTPLGLQDVLELVPPPLLAAPPLHPQQPRTWKDSMLAGNGEHPSGGGGAAQGRAGGRGGVFFDDNEAGLSGGDDDGEEDDMADMYEDAGGGGGGGGGGGIEGGEGDGQDDVGQVGGCMRPSLLVVALLLACSFG